MSDQPLSTAAFRRGFLLSLATNGVDPDRLDNFLRKQAGSGMLGFFSGAGVSDLPAGLGSGAEALGKVFVDFPVAATMAGGAVAGLAGGGGLYLATRKNYDQEVKDLQAREVGDTLKREILKIRLRMARRGQRLPPTIG